MANRILNKKTNPLPLVADNSVAQGVLADLLVHGNSTVELVNAFPPNNFQAALRLPKPFLSADLIDIQRKLVSEPLLSKLGDRAASFAGLAASNVVDGKP